MKLHLGFAFKNRWAQLALIIGLAASTLLAWQLHKINEQRVNDAVANAAEQTNAAVRNRLALYLYGLHGARGAVSIAGEQGISRELFQRYSLTRDIDREFPGAHGFGFIRRVPQARVASFVEQARADGWPDFRVKVLAPHDGDCYIIQYIEPVERNVQAVGLDIGSEKNRREAADAAMRTGEVRLTGPITLAPASGKPLQSFLMLMPIYRGGVTPPTEAEREQSAYGWSYAPLLIEEVLADLHLDADTVHLELFDVTTPGEEVMFYSNGHQQDQAVKLHTQRTRFEAYGRRWESRFSARPLFVQRLHQGSPLQVFLLGGLISLLAASLLGIVNISRWNRRQVLAEQARLAAIVENSSDGIVGKTLDGVVTSWNRGAEQIFGYPAQAAIGRKLADLIVPDHLKSEEEEILARIGNGEQIPHFETVRQHQNGDSIHVSVTVSPIHDSSGRVIGASKTVRDISSQKEAAARIRELNSNLEALVAQRTSELAELNMLFRNVLDAASEVSIVATDRDGTIRLFNTGAERLLGYRADELVGKRSPERFHLQQEAESRGAELSREFGRPVAGFEIFTLKAERDGAETREWSFVRKDGSLVPVMLVVTAMRDDKGQLSGYLEIATDITAQRRHSSELTAARDQLLMAAEVAQLGIWSWSLADNSVDWNDKMFELYAQPLTLRNNGLCFDHWQERVHPEDVEATVSCLQAAAQGKGTFEPVFRILLPDGRIRYIQAGARLERDEQGRAMRVTGINLDITTQRELEIRLRQAKELADEASAAKSTFLANMSHEIRTPMNAVLGMLQLVQQTELSQRQREYLGKAQTAARSLLGLLNDILDYSKIEAGKLQLELQPFELEELMQDLAVVLSGNLGDKPVELMFDLPPSLSVSLVGDRLRLQQILINLAGNAIKFTERGEVVVGISELSRGPASIRLCVQVTDTGIGIAEDKLEHILEGFNQADASIARRFGGTGLGLVITQRLIALMGGRLQVSSQPGVGSHFWFELNLGLAETARPPARGETSERPLRVLVVDDNKVSAEILARAAGSQGWQVNIANSGQAAVTEMAAGTDYDLVLMDWAMPDMNGLDAATRIREQVQGGLPTIIMVTAYGREQLAQAQQDADPPFTDFLTKPITTQQLVTTVRQALDGSRVEPGHRTVPAPSLQRLAGLRLLVVEDNALNRQVAAELLGGEGACVELAEGGLDGVRKVVEAPTAFDMVLMDMQMPDIDGLEATRRIRADAACRELPILAMTANVTAADQEACLAAGMNAHVGKPVDIENLIAVLLSFRSGADGLAVDQPVAGPSASIEDIDIILRRFGGNARLYRRLLSGLEENAAGLFGELEVHIRERDLTAAAAVLHTFKGVAGTMGAAGFASRMAELEQQLKTADTDSALNLLNAASLAELKVWLAQERATLLEAVTVPETEGEPATDETADGDSRRRFEQLLVLLEAGNLDAIDLVEEMTAGACDRLHARREELATEVQNLNFAAASRIVRELLEKT
ncbi:PAS domain-containing hybrid sensor histidine kinase/response regulator [Zobellella maritima]|uniref:PAS domain-containing hybrid sensor histidine kinase/response regulator n=1 Tax=Zobellella maritima TaxID=2059725 RepID=UPI000E304343|nr:CHASE domain-containing protein [Zobellella maritima]